MLSNLGSHDHLSVVIGDILSLQNEHFFLFIEKFETFFGLCFCSNYVFLI